MFRALLLGLAALLHASIADAQWVRVESANFVVFGEVGEKRTREYAAEFERFREALSRVVPGAAARQAAPALVFIFRDARSFAPYRPLYNGKPVQVSGYFAGGPGLDVIMLHAAGRDGAMRTIYHEYSHLVTVNAARGMPVWLGEGLAEYYSTFEVRDDGRRALLGGVVPGHLMRLLDGGLLPLDQLLAVEHDSPLYNEGSRRSTFYAQSWALVHMLLNGEPDRSAQFDRYVRLTSAGRTPIDAWREVFGDEKIGDELRRYVRQSRMKGFLFTFDRPVAPAAFTVSIPPPGDVHAALGDLRLHVSPGTAAAHMAGAEPSPYASAVQGLIELDENDDDRARELLVRAATGSTDWLVQYRAAAGLERIATAGQSDAHREAARVADRALASVLEARPDLPHAIALRGLIAGAGDQGIALLQRARELAPGRPHYAIWQAQFHSVRGEFVEARALLAPLLSPWVPPETREYARSVMAQAVTEQEARQPADRSASEARSSPVPPAGPGLVIPLYREVQPGEQRIEALFERIECPRSGVILHARSGDRPLRFAASELGSVELLTYREDLRGPVSCGAREPADKVYVTFRPSRGAGDLDGILIAIEFLPR